MSKRICEDCGRDMSYTESSRCRSVHSSCNGFAIEVEEDTSDIPHPHHNAKTVAVFKRTAMSTKEENKPLTLQECKDMIETMLFSAFNTGRTQLDRKFQAWYTENGFDKTVEYIVASQFRSTPPEKPDFEKMINDLGWDCDGTAESNDMLRLAERIWNTYVIGHKIDDNEKQ